MLEAAGLSVVRLAAAALAAQEAEVRELANLLRLVVEMGLKTQVRVAAVRAISTLVTAAQES